VSVDQPGEADVPPDGTGDQRDDQNDGPAGRADSVQPETRYRQEYDAELRVAAALEKSVTRQQAAAREEAAAVKWGEKVEEGRWMWGEYQRRWPPEERAPVDRSQDPAGSWRGEGTGSWTLRSTAGSRQRATGSPNWSETGSRQRYVPWNVKIQTGI